MLLVDTVPDDHDLAKIFNHTLHGAWPTRSGPPGSGSAAGRLLQLHACEFEFEVGSRMECEVGIMRVAIDSIWIWVAIEQLRMQQTMPAPAASRARRRQSASAKLNHLASESKQSTSELHRTADAVAGAENDQDTGERKCMALS